MQHCSHVANGRDRKIVRGSFRQPRGLCQNYDFRAQLRRVCGLSPHYLRKDAIRKTQQFQLVVRRERNHTARPGIGLVAFEYFDYASWANCEQRSGMTDGLIEIDSVLHGCEAFRCNAGSQKFQRGNQ